ALVLCRVLALEYGADLVYTEEIVDQKLLSSKRIVNSALNTIDYCMVDDIVLRISKAREQDRCVLQIGTNSGESAAKVAKMVGTDVAAIDVNMGCPKPFSIHRGMGAALLTQVEKVKEILTSLKSVAQVPVSCKIRVLDDQAETLNLVREIEKCGVAALGVHGRRRDERDPHPCRMDEIREVARTVSIPVIANGGSGEISTPMKIS
ncbi:dihydrouridine synthase, partial [Oesophagostomum dentatum]